MPNYKYNKFFHKNNSKAFDAVHSPGDIAPSSGIFKCEACGFEAVSTKGNPLPPATDCRTHDKAWKCEKGEVSWRLVAAAIHVRKG